MNAEYGAEDATRDAGEGAREDASERAGQRVCVVIWDGSVPEAELRQYLDDALPLRFVRWQDRTYLATIEELRPRVIVAVEPDDELAADVAGLLACLVVSYTPTILGMTLAPPNPGAAKAVARRRAPGKPAAAVARPRLLVRQLAPCEGARIDSLADITFT